MPSIDNAVIVLVVKLKLLQKLAQMPVVFCLFTITSIYISFAISSIVTLLFINPESLLVTPQEKLPASIRAEVFKNILIDKFESDIDGLAEQPKTYLEYLRRRNTTLYDKLIKDNRFERNNESWMNDVMTVILAIESELSLHLKYFEQSVLGESLFFKPLITLIKHFKSSLVQIARTGLKYVFDDKVDLGGNSIMLKLFDELNFSIHFTTIKSAGYDSSFGRLHGRCKTIT